MKISIRPVHDPKHVSEDMKINDILSKVNGKAGVHTFDHVSQIWPLAVAAEARLEALRLPKKYRQGACFLAVSGEAVPNKYKYARIATMVKLKRGPKCWFLIAAERTGIYQIGGWCDLYITKEQDKAAVELMRSEYNLI